MTRSTETTATRARLILGAATLALATAFTVAPGMLPFGGFDGAAHAKEKSDKGNRGGGREKAKDRGKSGGSDTSDRGRSGEARDWSGGSKAKATAPKAPNHGQQKKIERTSAAPKVKAQAKTVRTEQTDAADDTATASLDPNRKGRWNAMNASDRAIEVHIEKGNFNGTVGTLAQYALTAKAASGADLTDGERASLERLLADSGYTDVPVSVSDDEVTAALNEGVDPDLGYSWTYVDGDVTCTGACDDLTEADIVAAGLAADAYVAVETEERAAVNRDNLDALYAASEQRIIDGSNKDLTEAEADILLDELAVRYLGQPRDVLFPVVDPDADTDVVLDDPVTDEPVDPVVVVTDPVADTVTEPGTEVADNF